MQSATLGYRQVAAQAPVGERLAFLKKVYGLLSLSVLLAAGAAWITSNNIPFASFVAQNMLMFFILEIGAIFFTFWARKRETMGLIALFSFTILTGITTTPLLLAYTGGTVTMAAFLTGLTFAGLSFYALTTKRDLTFMGGMLRTGLILLIVGSLLNAFLFKSAWGSFGISCVGVFLFSGFILYDTKNIMHRYPTDEVISATLTLYLDILNLFIFILHIIGFSKD
jgi:modulator of FtsH protease